MKSTNLSHEEIIILLNKYNKLVDECIDTGLINVYNIRILNFTTIGCDGSTKVKVYCNHILSYLGYHNDIYKLESEVLSDKLYKELEWDTGGRGYTNELLATCVIREIFNYYLHEWTELQLLSIYNPNYKLFLNTSIKCSRWCNNHYWKAKVKHK